MLVVWFMGVMRAHVHACRMYGHACVYLCISYLSSLTFKVFPTPPPPPGGFPFPRRKCMNFFVCMCVDAS